MDSLKKAFGFAIALTFMLTQISARADSGANSKEYLAGLTCSAIAQHFSSKAYDQSDFNFCAKNASLSTDGVIGNVDSTGMNFRGKLRKHDRSELKCIVFVSNLDTSSTPSIRIDRCHSRQ